MKYEVGSFSMQRKLFEFIEIKALLTGQRTKGINFFLPSDTRAIRKSYTMLCQPGAIMGTSLVLGKEKMVLYKSFEGKSSINTIEKDYFFLIL